MPIRRRDRDSGQAMVCHIRRNITEVYGRGAFRKMYLTEPEGCVPDEFTGDDLLLAIKEKFYWPADAVRRQLQSDFGSPPFMHIYIDPSYDDATHLLLTLEHDYILFHNEAKSWHVWWPEERGMKDTLEHWHGIARERYIRFTGGR